MIGKGLLVSEGFWYVYSKITADCKYSFERGRKMLMKHNLKKNEKKKKDMKKAEKLANPLTFLKKRNKLT